MKKILIITLQIIMLITFSACSPTTDKPVTDEALVNQVKKDLQLTLHPNDTVDTVTQKITLPTHINGVTITWSSSNENVIKIDGTVIRPDDENVEVKLHATLTLNDVSDTKEFKVIVLKNDEEAYDITKRNGLNENEIKYTFEQQTTYQNPIEIDGQWGGVNPNNYAYGIGDPFVLRYNGKYYLYPSTQDWIPGIRVFESDDMVNWTFKGFAVLESEESSTGAYAPEVVYYNGYFYLVQSKGGSGHYLYKADNPLGPFERITGNLGRGIDGAFHINDDGRLYLMHTGIPAGLRMSEILNLPDTLSEDDLGILGPQRLMETANLNHWIEGPGIIRRDNISYLTYTGNHIASIGYRIAYSYTFGNMVEHDGFIQPENNVTLISTKDDYSGLGHSSNAYGPNLDSIYTAYHNRDQNGRRYNLDRYITNGIRLSSNAAYNHFGYIPKRPDFEANDESGLTNDLLNFKLSKQATKDYYTAEFNYIMGEGDVILNYQNHSNFHKLNINKETHTIELIEVVDGKSTSLATNTLTLNNNYERLTELRVEKSLTTLRIFYNNMLKIDIEYVGHGGKIGYMGAHEIYYTAFQNDVNGSSDFEVVHGIPSNIPAHVYLKDENRGFKFHSETLTNDPIRMGENNQIIHKSNQYAVRLDTKEDFVKYAVEGLNNSYALVAEITKESLGSIIEIILNEEEIIKVDVPTDIHFPEGVTYLPIHLTNLNIDGQTSIKFRLFKGQFEFRQFQLYEDAYVESYENLNGEALIDQLDQVGHGRFVAEDGAIHSNTSEIFMGLLGHSGAPNFEFSVDVALITSGVSDGGIVFRAKNYSYHKDQPTQSFQGYYLKIQERAGTFYKYDYGSQTIRSIALIDENRASLFTPGTFNTIKVISYQNNIQIYINGVLYLDEHLDEQLMDGQVGFFSRNTHFAYKNVSYHVLD